MRALEHSKADLRRYWPRTAYRPLSPAALRRSAGWLEAGLDAAALLFFPLLVLAPRGVAPLASAAGLFAGGLVLSAGIRAWRPALTAPAALLGSLLAWGIVSALWAIDPRHSLDMAARLAGLFAAGLALAAAVDLLAAPRRLTLFLLGGFVLGIAMAAADFATRGALSAPFSSRVYQAAWLNQASVAFAILLLPASAVPLRRGRAAVALLLAAAGVATVYMLAGTAAKTALTAGLVMALLLYVSRIRAARAAAAASILLIVTAPLTFARLERLPAFTETADAIKQSAGHRLLIWSFVGDRIAEHAIIGWGLDSSRAIPGGNDPIEPGETWLPLASSQCAAATLARARRAGRRALCAGDGVSLARPRRRRLAAPLRRGGGRRPRGGICRLSRHLRHLAGMVARHLVVFAVPRVRHGAGSGAAGRRPSRRRRLMRVFTLLPMRHWREAAPFAAAAEAVGFDGVMTVELGHEVFTPLAFAALATGRIELTSSVAVAFPRSPTIMAGQAWDLHANSGGRLVLGLGSQVKGHNERRFGIAWSPPAPRLRDFIRALRAVWRCWETGARLDYRGEHYRLTLMTPDFSPEPAGLAMPPIAVAAVGAAMLRVAGEVGDGVRLHPLCSRRYLEEVCLPQIAEGMRRSGRSRAHFDIHGGGFVATGPDEAAVRQAMDRVRKRIAFYGSTRTYLPILALHGLDEIGLRLHRLSVDRRWDEMAAEIPDDIVRLFAACGTYREITGAIAQRYGGLANSIEMNFPADAPGGLQRELVSDIRRIPHAFAGFDTRW